MKKGILISIMVGLWLTLLVTAGLAQTAMDCQTEVTVQVNDSLVKIAEQHYGDYHAYSEIIRATNAKAATDPSYPVIRNPNLIQPGWKLCLPNLNQPMVDDSNLPLVTPSVISTSTQHLLTIDGPSDEDFPQGTVSSGKLYQLTGGPEVKIQPIDNFVFPLLINGPIHLALARPTADSSVLPLISTTTSSDIGWILFLPNEIEGVDATHWRAITLDDTDLAVIEYPIAETVHFQHDPTDTQTSVTSLLEAKEAYEAETGTNLWIDFALAEEREGLYTLYAFAVFPEAPGPGDEARTFCCRWMGCHSPSQSCRFWGCNGVC